MAHAAFRIRNTGLAQEPVRDCIAPHRGLAGLILELGQDLSVALIVHASLERFPLAHIAFDRFRSLVVRIVDVLNHGLAGMQLVRVGHVMQEQKQIVGTSCERLIHPRD